MDRILFLQKLDQVCEYKFEFDDRPVVTRIFTKPMSCPGRGCSQTVTTQRKCSIVKQKGWWKEICNTCKVRTTETTDFSN
jgi:hypothetical protein